jgi:hypothetical protein
MRKPAPARAYALLLEAYTCGHFLVDVLSAPAGGAAAGRGSAYVMYSRVDDVHHCTARCTHWLRGSSHRKPSAAEPVPVELEIRTYDAQSGAYVVNDWRFVTMDEALAATPTGDDAV